MQPFAALLRHDYLMSIRRRGLWVAYGLLFVFYTVILFSPPPLGEMVRGETIASREVWAAAGRFMVALNVYFPVAVGILAADRVQRDVRLGLWELQRSTPLGLPNYVISKYLAVLSSFLVPVLAWVMAVVTVMVAIGHAPGSLLAAAPVAFMVIVVPAFAFVVAFSLACPLLMPLSVYQILFTGYWFWANFIPPKLFPTLNGTLLTPSGVFALQGFFSGHVTRTGETELVYTAADAALNLTVLAGCTLAALLFLGRALSARMRRA